MRIGRHPRHRTLSQYVDDELTGARRREIGEHLDGCLRCQREVDFMQEVQRGLREIAKPRPPRDVLEHILERRDAGERIILPTAWAAPRRLRPAVPVATAVAAVLLVAAVGLLLLGNGEAAAGASGLTFSPASLDRSHEINVEYTTVGALAAEPKLVLRGRYFTADDEPQLGEGGTYFSTELWPEGDGAFRGSVRLPGSAVYAHAAVEDREGAYVDHTGYRSWELMARYGDGHPRFESLWQRARAFEERDANEAYESIKRLTELYPDRVEGWSVRYAYERSAVGSTLSDRLEQLHWEKFKEFQRRAATTTPSVSELGELVNYARRLGDRSALERWTGELERLHPAHPIAVRERVLRLQETRRGEPRAVLEEYEREWERVGPIEPLLLQSALDAALAAKDAAAIRLWADRFASRQPSRIRSLARRLADLPELRPFAADLIRDELRRLERVSDLERPIHLSVSEYRLAQRRQRHDLLATLGRLLVADGREAAGFDTLLLAADARWDPELFDELAEISAARGDVSTALRFEALAAIDPLGGEEARENPPGRIARLTTAASWAVAVEAAREELWDRVRATSVNRNLVGDVALRVQDGTSTPLDRLLGENVTVVFLWSRWASTTAEMSERLLAYRERLASRGIEILAITRDSHVEPTLRKWWAELSGDLPIYVDPQGQAKVALNSFDTPDVLVLDGAGRVRFDPVDPEEAVRVALTLEEHG